MSIDVLLIECKGCGRRSALGKGDAPIRQGNMQPLHSARFKCRQCGGVEVRTYIPHSHDEATMWLAGDPLPQGRQAT